MQQNNCRTTLNQWRVVQRIPKSLSNSTSSWSTHLTKKSLCRLRSIFQTLKQLLSNSLNPQDHPLPSTFMMMTKWSLLVQCLWFTDHSREVCRSRSVYRASLKTLLIHAKHSCLYSSDNSTRTCSWAIWDYFWCRKNSLCHRFPRCLSKWIRSINKHLLREDRFANKSEMSHASRKRTSRLINFSLSISWSFSSSVWADCALTRLSEQTP